jgi:AcrR family transcriptional regulator
MWPSGEDDLLFKLRWAAGTLRNQPQHRAATWRTLARPAEELIAEPIPDEATPVCDHLTVIYGRILRSVPSSVGRQSILAAGCDLVRRDGLDALSLRAVAGLVGVTPMALYRYVEGATDLHDSVLSSILDSLPSAPESIDDLGSWAQALRAWLAEVPGLPRFVLLHWYELPALLDVVERLLAIFAAQGLDGFDLVAAANALFTYVLARGEIEETVRSLGVRRSLPWTTLGERRPLLSANRRHYEVARLDEHFAYGLDLLVGQLRQSTPSASR